MIQDTCFRPKPDWVGDVIPWTDQEEIRLYYLLERRRLPKPGTPWSLVVTNDLVHYEDCGEALPSGGVDGGTRRCTALQGTLVGPSFSRRGIRRVPTGAEGSWRG